MIRLALAVAVILTLASSCANAQSPETQSPGAPGEQPPGEQPPGAQAPGARAFPAACEPDLAQFCSQVQPGAGRLRSCMKQHFREVSPGCKQAIIQARRQQ